MKIPRRKYIVSGVTLALAAMAGCSSTEDSDNGTETATATETGSTDESQPGETETATEGDETSTEEETPTEDEEPTATEEDTVTYGGIFVYEQNYAVDMDYVDPESGESGTVSGKYHGDDYYIHIEPDGTSDVYELYHVEDDDYVVVNGEDCYVNPGSLVKPDADVESESDAKAHGDKPDADLNPTGTTTIDGEEVYIFELSGEDVDGTYTLYVSVSTGYLRRVEKGETTADFHSWGTIDPISKPDMTCQSF